MQLHTRLRARDLEEFFSQIGKVLIVTSGNAFLPFFIFYMLWFKFQTNSLNRFR